MNKKYISVALGVGTSLAMIVPAFAQSDMQTNTSQKMMSGNTKERSMRDQEGKERGFNGGQMMTRPVVTGTVTTINGNILTISGHQGMLGSTTPATTFTIDGSNAKVTKNKATSTLSAIVSGDIISVEGTLTGTNVVATFIRDGSMMNAHNERGSMVNGVQGSGAVMNQLQGNGQPIVAGIVSGISGTTLTITNKSNVTYTVEASTSKVLINSTTSSLTLVKIGDNVIVQGAVNGTSITATTVIDTGVPKATPQAGQVTTPKQTSQGFFGGMGSFFSRIFGF